MNLLDSIAIRLFIYVAIGILLAYYLPISLLVSLVLCFICLCFIGLQSIFFTIGRHLAFQVLFGLSGICLGLLSTNLSLPKNHPKHYSKQEHKKKCTLTLRILDKLKDNKFHQRFIAEILTLENRPSEGRILLLLPVQDSTIRLSIDDLILTKATIEEIRASLNPYQFDYKKYMALQKIYHQIQSSSRTLIKGNSSKTIRKAAEKLRHKLINYLEKFQFKKREYGILRALLLGDRQAITPEVFKSFKKAGAVHLLAVSGLHIGVVLLLLQFVYSPLKLLPNGTKFCTLATIATLWFYALLCGFTASVVRAVCMFSFLSYGLYLKRYRSAYNTVGLSLLFLLILLDPLLLFQTGFQLSYSAVISILWLYPKISGLWRPTNTVLRKTWELMALSISAQIGVFPLILYYFHEFPLLFFISNIIVVPILGLLLGTGFILLLLAALDLTPTVFLRIYEALLFWINETITLLGSQDLFIVKNIYLDEVGVVLLYLSILFLFTTLGKRLFYLYKSPLIAFLIFQLWNSYSIFNKLQENKLFVMHKKDQTILVSKVRNNLTIYSKDTLFDQKLIDPLLTEERIKKVHFKKLVYAYSLNNKNLLLITKPILPYPFNKPIDYLLLSNSPNINLNRYLDSLTPKLVIADGSNYPTFVDRWKKSCVNKRIPFYSTRELGAFQLITER